MARSEGKPQSEHGLMLQDCKKEVTWKVAVKGDTDVAIYRQVDQKYFEQIFKYECRMELREKFPWQTPSQIKNLVESLLEDRQRVIDDALFIESRKQVVGFKNKVFDLYSGKVRHYQPSDYVLNPLPYDIPEQIEPEVAQEFFEVCSDWVGSEMAGWFQDLLAYLIGIFPNGEHLWVNLFGIGKNGKSSVLNLLRALVGEDKCIDTDLKHIGKFSGDAFRGKWLVVGDDSTEYVPDAAVGFIKRFTGTQTLHIEKKGGAEWDEMNTGKLIVNTNYLIQSKDRSFGWYRRIVPIPFTNRFTIDPTFDERLARKAPQIARILMHKAYLIKHNHTRLTQCLPEKVQILKTETQMLNDRLSAFFNLWFYKTTDREMSVNGQVKRVSVTERDRKNSPSCTKLKCHVYMMYIVRGTKKNSATGLQ